MIAKNEDEMSEVSEGSPTSVAHDEQISIRELSRSIHKFKEESNRRIEGFFEMIPRYLQEQTQAASEEMRREFRETMKAAKEEERQSK